MAWWIILWVYAQEWYIAGFSGISICNFQRNLQIDFQSSSTSLQSHQQWRSDDDDFSFSLMVLTSFWKWSVYSCLDSFLGFPFDCIINLIHFIPIPGRFYYYCSVVQLEFRVGDSTRSSSIVENSFHYPGFSVIPDELENCSFYSMRNWGVILLGIALNL